MAELDVVYVLHRFPCLTETFIAEEIRSMQAKGVNLRLYSLLAPRDRLIQPLSQRLLAQVRYAPGFFSLAVWLAQLHFIFQAPTQYFGLLVTILRQPTPRVSFLLKRAVIFAKGVWVASQLEHTSVQLVHTHFAWLSAAAGIVVSRLLHLPFTVTTHAYDIYSERNDLLRLASNSAERIVTISETNKRAILAMNPAVASGAVEVVHCGIDLDSFQPPAERATSRIIQITSVGSLITKKGHEYLIRACGLLRDEGVDFRCTIVGSGNLEPSLRNLIGELRLEEKVVLAGAQSQEWVRDRLGVSDVFVLACVTEPVGGRDGIPVAIMEAMAMGVPVISTPVSGIPELVRDADTGLLVPERNANELAAAMVRVTSDAHMHARLARSARDLVHREYNIVSTTSRLRAIFEQLIWSKNPRIGSPA